MQANCSPGKHQCHCPQPHHPAPCRFLVCSSAQGHSKHYAFVEFAMPESAQAALKAINAKQGQKGGGGGDAAKGGTKR